MVRSCCVFMFVTVLGILCLAGCSNEEKEQMIAELNTGSGSSSIVSTGTIVALGDSLTAGYGLDEEQGYPYQLEQKLHANGYQFTVVNAGVSAETSSGALSRIEWILTLEPDIVILETGANDGLRGIDPELAEENIRKILQRLEQQDVTVLLAGMKMVWNLGPVYVKKFNTIYPKLAAEFDVELMPFFLKDVATVADLNLDDGVHPNSKGYGVITENIYPHVIRVIKKRASND